MHIVTDVVKVVGIAAYGVIIAKLLTTLPSLGNAPSDADLLPQPDPDFNLEEVEAELAPNVQDDPDHTILRGGVRRPAQFDWESLEQPGRSCHTELA